MHIVMTNSDALTFTLDPTTDTASAVCVAFTIPHEAWQSAGSAEDDGAVGQVRADRAAKEAVSTVDNVDTVAGRIATIRALGKQKDGKAGHYGAAANASDATPE